MATPRQFRCYRFGDWLVEPHLGSVSNGEDVRKLEPKAMDVLALLLEHPGQVRSPTEILDSVWAGRIVEEGAVHQKISQIRGALGDDRRCPRYIESIPKRGYRTLEAVEVQAIPVSPPVLGESIPSVFERPTGERRRVWWVAGMAIALAAVIAVAIAMFWRWENAGGHPKESIAVLPFANLSGDPNQEYFADGLTEELLNSLATIDELRVISRTSSFALKGRNQPLSEAAATLGVGHILEGGVRRAGNRIRVTAQLIDTGSDSQLWSGSYDRELSLDNILEIQKEIAFMVVDALQLELVAPSSDSPAIGGPDNLAALDLYQEGMFHLRQIEIGQHDNNTTFERAIKKFEASIEADPKWAPSRAALGRVYHFWKDVGDAAGKLRISKRHIMEAIRLDPNYRPAYESLGYILSVEGDYEGAMRAYDRADRTWGEAILLMVLARYDEAVDEFREALAHDPLSVVIKDQLIDAYYCAGRYTDVIDGSDALLSIEPGIEYAQIRLAMAHARNGDLESGLRLADVIADQIDTEAPFATLFALAGQTARARAALTALERNEPDLVPAALLDSAAPAAIVLGEEDRALTLLEQLTAETSNLSHAFNLLYYMRCSPEVRSLAGNPRYEALLDRLRLPD